MAGEGVCSGALAHFARVAISVKVTIVLVFIISYNSGSRCRTPTIGRGSSLPFVHSHKVSALVSSSNVVHCGVATRR